MFFLNIINIVLIIVIAILQFIIHQNNFEIIIIFIKYIVWKINYIKIYKHSKILKIIII